MTMEIYDTFFGDLPLSLWCNHCGVMDEMILVEPWHSFVAAIKLEQTGDIVQSIAILNKVIEMPDLESRHYLEAFHQLRMLGWSLDKSVELYYGTVIEVGLPKGRDVIAAYEDGSARYINFGGSAIIWEPQKFLHPIQNAIVSFSHVVRERSPIIPFSKNPRTIELRNGEVRISALTSRGIRAIEASFTSLAKDAYYGPIMTEAFNLTRALMQWKP
jgi:hypothetical protein